MAGYINFRVVNPYIGFKVTQPVKTPPLCPREHKIQKRNYGLNLRHINIRAWNKRLKKKKIGSEVRRKKLKRMGCLKEDVAICIKCC